MKILLCEDDQNIATIARLALETVGKNEVIWVTDGRAAYEAILTCAHDLILLDDMMPKLSGVEVCARLAEHLQLNPGAELPPIVFMSANPQEKQVETHSHFVIGYIPKPFEPMNLNTQIATLLAERVRSAG